MTFRALQTTFTNPDSVDAFNDDPRTAPDNEFDEFACLDANTCSNDGGHMFLAKCGVVRCIYCGTVTL